MERRHFLLGLFGLAGAAAVTGVLGPQPVEAAMPRPGKGILDEIDGDVAGLEQPDSVDDGAVELANHRPGHRRPPRRRRRRRVWRRVCSRVRHQGRWVRRCYRRRVWVSVWI
ncbi:MAG: twin-arginine translocation signal domain-containing protein [Rhizobiaceae bacterium]